MSSHACVGGCAAQTSTAGGTLMEDQTNGPATRAREEGALELAESKSMKPYMSLTIAMIQGRDVATALREIASLPLEERYVWRIASTLKWACRFQPVKPSRGYQVAAPCRFGQGSPVGEKSSKCSFVCFSPSYTRWTKPIECSARAQVKTRRPIWVVQGTCRSGRKWFLGKL